MSDVFRRADIPSDLRQYFVRAEIGLEETPEAYVERLVGVFREVRRVLRPDATLWLNLGDSYAATRSYQVSDSKHRAHDFGGSNAQSTPFVGVEISPKYARMAGDRIRDDAPLFNEVEVG